MQEYCPDIYSVARERVMILLIGLMSMEYKLVLIIRLMESLMLLSFWPVKVESLLMLMAVISHRKMDMFLQAGIKNKYFLA